MSNFIEKMTDFITGVGIIETKRRHYLISFINEISQREYVFLVEKLLFDDAFEKRTQREAPTSTITTAEILKERNKVKGAMHT